MKKLTRSSLEELAKEMPVLSEVEQQIYIGGDIVEMDANGHFLRRIEKDGPDQIYVGPSTTDPRDSGTFISMPEGITPHEYDIKDSSGNLTGEKGFTFDDITGSGNFGDYEKLFKALSNATNVEWGLVADSKNKGGMVYTSHGEHSLDISIAKDSEAKQNRNFDTFMHNHEESNDESPDDVDGNASLKNYGFKKFGVYSEKDDETQWY